MGFGLDLKGQSSKLNQLLPNFDDASMVPSAQSSPSWTTSLWVVASRRGQQAHWLRPEGFLDLNGSDNGPRSLVHWVPGRTLGISHSWTVSICGVQLYSERSFHFEGLRTMGLWLYKPRLPGGKWRFRKLWDPCGDSSLFPEAKRH